MNPRYRGYEPRDLAAGLLRIIFYLLVGKVGFEPTSPQETDLQSAAALQLCRLPIFLKGQIIPTKNLTVVTILRLIYIIITPTFICKARSFISIIY